jgi:hypothetical protein
MSSLDHWRLAIDAVGVAATALIALLAIWGEFIRSKFAGPSLSVTLLSADGERTTFRNIEEPGSPQTPTRYYHLRISNARQWAPARNARVVLIGLARAAADQSFAKVLLSGPLQLAWQFPGQNPQYPTIGPDHTCDLGHVESVSGFSLALYVTPNNFRGTIAAMERMRVEIRVGHDDGESAPLFLEIAWDGMWSDDTVEMRRHLIVKKVKSLV